MEAILRDGDYIADGRGGIRSARGNEELLARALLKLSARRGGLSVLPGFGSRLHTLSRIPPENRETAARAFIAEALAGEPLEVRDIRISDTGDGRFQIEVFLLFSDGDEGTAALNLTW